MIATSSNRSEILAIHETSHEYIWLRFMIQHIQESCELSSTKDTPTILFEDKIACIAQLQEATSKVTTSKTYHRSSSTPMSSKRKAMLIFNKYDQVTI